MQKQTSIQTLRSFIRLREEIHKGQVFPTVKHKKAYKSVKPERRKNENTICLGGLVTSSLKCTLCTLLFTSNRSTERPLAAVWQISFSCAAFSDNDTWDLGARYQGLPWSLSAQTTSHSPRKSITLAEAFRWAVLLTWFKQWRILVLKPERSVVLIIATPVSRHLLDPDFQVRQPRSLYCIQKYSDFCPKQRHGCLERIWLNKPRRNVS